MNINARVRGLRQAVDELYAMVDRATSGAAGAIVNVKDFGATGNGVTDDAPAIQRGVNTATATGRILWFSPGTYKVGSPIVLSAGPITLLGCADAILVGAMTTTGAQLHNILYATALNAAGNTGTPDATGTLNGNAVQGTNSISYAVATGPAPVAGQIAVISHGDSGQYFTINSVAGGGPYTLTLDVDVAFPFVSTDPIEIFTTQPHDIRIAGNGLRFSGTGDRAIEIVGGLRCFIDDVHFNTSLGVMGDAAFSFDIGGRFVGFSRCSADGLGAASSFYGLLLEASVDSVIDRCRVSRCPNVGVAILDGSGSYISDSHYQGVGASNATGAFGVGTDGALGSFDCGITNCTSLGGVNGLFLNGSTRTKITSCAFTYASGVGIDFAVAAVTETVGTNVSVANCFTGLSTVAGNKPTHFYGLDASACTNACLAVADDFSVDGLILKSPTAVNLVQISAGNVRLSNVDCVSSVPAAVVFFCNTSSRVAISNAQVELDGNGSTAIAPFRGVVAAKSVAVTGTGTGLAAAQITSGATFRQDGFCAFGAASVNNNGYWSRGAGGNGANTVTANGAGTPQALAFSDANAQDRLVLEMVAKAGTPGIPLVITTGGTGSSVTFAAGDTSTYNPVYV